MINTSIIIDKRKLCKNNTFPIKIYFSINGKPIFIKTGVFVTEEEWSSINTNPTPKQKTIKKYLTGKQLQVDGRLMELERIDQLQTVTAKLLDDNKYDYVEAAPNQVEYYLDLKIKQAKALSTKETYQDTLRILTRFADITTLQFSDITVSFLKRLELFLSDRSVNGRGVVFRNIRAVYNDAIDDSVVSIADYPFRRFKIKKEETAHRVLDITTMRKIRDAQIPEWAQRYRDLFLLSFYLVGVNFSDLLQATEENIKNGRFEYRRNKTGRLYSIKIEPEAQEIIERYKGEKYLLNCMDTRSNYKDFLHRTNDALKKIKYAPKDKEPIMPELSTYYSRHSWATYAADNNINDSVISFALGHKASNRVTDIYVRRNKLKVDEANRKVIDYFNSNDIIEY